MQFTRTTCYIFWIKINWQINLFYLG